MAPFKAVLDQKDAHRDPRVPDPAGERGQGSKRQVGRIDFAKEALLERKWLHLSTDWGRSAAEN